MKFVKAKEPVVVASTTETIKNEKKKNVANQRMLNKPRNEWVLELKPKGNHFINHKEVQEYNVSVITMDNKDTPDQIVISWRYWRMQVIRGQKDLEMTKGIELLSNQEVKMVIPVWWT